MKVLIAERGAFTPQDREQLDKLGFNVVYCYPHAIDSIKSASEVPLRDYFAAAALQGFCIGFCTAFSENMKDTLVAELAAQFAYRAAYAMLAEREKSK